MKKRLLTLCLVLVMLLGMMAGCGKTEAPAASNGETAVATTDKEVELVMYLIGDRTPDLDKGFGKINEKLKEKINATITVKFLGWGEYEQKYPLLFASGEEFDLIYTSDWAMYNQQASKGGFWEITPEALEAYAPLTAETMYDAAWEQAKIGGKVYMLPMNYKEVTGHVFLVRGDLMEKYDIDKLETREDMEAYMDAIAQYEDGMIPLDIGADIDNRLLFDYIFFYGAVNGRMEMIYPRQLMAYTGADDDEVNVINITEDPAFIETATIMQDWNQRGFFSKSALVNKQSSQESFAAGKSAVALMNMANAQGEYVNNVLAHPEWDVQVVDAQFGTPVLIRSFLANGMGIFSKSKNPERALMALDLLRNDEELHDLFCYGIEGEHYIDNGDGTIELTDKNSNYPYDMNCNWGIRNDAYWKTIEGGIPNYDEINDKWMETAKSDKFVAFNFITDSVKNELAAMSDIYTTDLLLLYMGFTDDLEGDIAKIQQKLDAAGADVVYEELSRQAREWLASQN